MQRTPGHGQFKSELHQDILLFTVYCSLKILPNS